MHILYTFLENLSSILIHLLDIHPKKSYNTFGVIFLKIKAFGSILIAGALWGTISIFIEKMTAFGLDSMQIVFFRAAVTAVVLLVYGFIADRESLKIKLKDLWIFIGTGIISFVFFNYCYFTSIKLSSVSVAAALLYTAPVFVVFFSAVLFREKLTAQKLIAALATVLGCLLLSGMSAQQGAGGNMSGILWGIASGFLYGLYSIFGEYGILRKYKSITITTYTFLFAALASCFMIDLPQTFSAVASTDGLMWVLLLGVLSCVVPYLMYTKGLSEVSPSTAAVAATIEPAVACLVGIFYFKEGVSAVKLLGIALILSAVVLLNLRIKQKTDAF